MEIIFDIMSKLSKVINVDVLVGIFDIETDYAIKFSWSDKETQQIQFLQYNISKSGLINHKETVFNNFKIFMENEIKILEKDIKEKELLNDPEFMSMIADLDFTVPKIVFRYEQWKDEDGSKEGLENILKIQNNKYENIN